VFVEYAYHADFVVVTRTAHRALRPSHNKHRARLARGTGLLGSGMSLNLQQFGSESVTRTKNRLHSAAALSSDLV
jgi:hypothetical protein